MAATNLQVQAYVDQRVRPRSNNVVDLINELTQDQAVIGDVYANLTNSPTWTDNRTDGPAHLAVPNDVLAWNTFVVRTLQFWNGTLDPANIADAPAQLAIIKKLSTR